MTNVKWYFSWRLWVPTIIIFFVVFIYVGGGTLQSMQSWLWGFDPNNYWYPADNWNFDHGWIESEISQHIAFTLVLPVLLVLNFFKNRQRRNRKMQSGEL